MQQVAKEAGVNSVLKLLMLFFVLILPFNKAFAQIDNFEFQRIFLKDFHYPDVLKRTCTPTFTNLLLIVSDDGIINDIFVSDSAPKAFKDEFNEIKSQLKLSKCNLDSINHDNGIKYNIIIPVFYVYKSDYCVNSFEQAGYISDNYFYFNGKKLDIPCYNLKPIINIIYKPIH